MRVFISHCISDDPVRLEAFRDSAADVEALRQLGNALRAAGHRVFEYLHQREETRRSHILDMMARQISLADVVVLAVTRQSYVAPGWTVPELFCAHACKKPILCCTLRAGAGFNGTAFGDTLMAGRFQSLLPPGVSCPDVPALLHSLAQLPAPATGQPPDVFHLSEQLLSWTARSRWYENGSIESFLTEYHAAWAHGFRPARFFLKPHTSPVEGGQVEKVSTWIDNQHVVVRWRTPQGAGHLTLLDVRAGPQATAPLPAGETVITTGHSQGGGLVLVTSAPGEGNAVTLRRFSTGGREVSSFQASLSAPPAVTSGVIQDRWFAGSELLRVRWESGQLEPLPPQAEDLAQFQRLAWQETPADRLTTAETAAAAAVAAVSDSALVLFSGMASPLDSGTGEDGFWTLLPETWPHLRGNAPAARHLLVTWHQGCVWFGDVGATGSPFGLGLPDVMMHQEDGLESSDSAPWVPDFLLQLCHEQNADKHRQAITAPSMVAERVEHETGLVLQWRASWPGKNSRRRLFTFSAGLLSTQRLSRQVINLTADDEGDE